MFNRRTEQLTATGCTIAANNADSQGGGIDNYADGTITLINTILWDNVPVGIEDFNATAWAETVHSDIQDSYSSDNATISASPLFVAGQDAPLRTGTWIDVAYDAEALQTVLTLDGSPLAPGALIGLFVQPDDSDPRWFVIVDNSETEIRVWGDLTDPAMYTFSTDQYAIFDLHLQSTSPCVDAGYGCSTAGGCTLPPWVPETSPTDLESRPRIDADPPGPNGGAGDPSYVDMGAYEYHP
jgi:hypothetical protein